MCSGCGKEKPRAYFSKKQLSRPVRKCGMCLGSSLLCRGCNEERPNASFSSQEQKKLEPTCINCVATAAVLLRCSICKASQPLSAFAKAERAEEDARRCQACFAKAAVSGGAKRKHGGEHATKRGRRSSAPLKARAARALASAEDLARWECEDLVLAGADLSDPAVCSVSL